LECEIQFPLFLITHIIKFQSKYHCHKTTQGDNMIFDEMHEEGEHMSDWFGMSWMSYGWIFMVLFWVGFFIIAIIFAYFVHRDAVRRRIPNPEVWVLIVLIFSLIGLIVYLLARRNYTERDLTR